MATEQLNEVLTALGGEEAPDNLKSTLYEEIIKAAGGSVDDLPDNLETTYLKRIAEAVAGGSGGGGGEGEVTPPPINDGKTRIYVKFEVDGMSPMLGCMPNGTVTVDWGDGTEPTTLTGTSTTTEKWTKNHSYAKAGEYVITLTVDGEVALFGQNSTGPASSLLRRTKYSENQDYIYATAIRRVEVGNGVVFDSHAFGMCYHLTHATFPDGMLSIGGYTFRSCYNLKNVTLPNSVTSIGNSVFSSCPNLSSIEIPNTVTSIGDNAFASCYGLANITLPNSIQTIGYQSFNSCYGLTNITIPNSVTSIGGSAFRGCSGLVDVIMPSGLTSIGSNAFDLCYSLKRVDFTACTSVPTLENVNAFYKNQPNFEMLIPSALYDEWSAATNWTSFKNYMKPVGDAGNAVINFTIDGTSYQADEGMTWADWCGSSYNTAGYVASSSYQNVIAPSGNSVLDASGYVVDKSAAIINSHAYTSYNAGGGGAN